MGPCADLFDELFERVLVLDSADQTKLLEFFRNNPSYRKEVKKQCKIVDDLGNELNEAKNLEILYSELFLNPKVSCKDVYVKFFTSLYRMKIKN